MKRFIVFLISVSMLSCSDPELEQIDSCTDVIIVDGTTERFCNGPIIDFKTNLETVGDLYIQYKSDSEFGNPASDNFEGYNIAFANIKPDSTDWESEAEFFENLTNLLRPETKLQLDLSVLGGFAIELWDLEGVYYSSELGQQEADTYIETRQMNLKVEGPTYSQVYNTIDIILVTTKPVKVWNQTRTKSKLIELDWMKYTISFNQFRE